MKEFTKKKLMEVFEVARKEGAGIEVGNPPRTRGPRDYY